MDSSFRWRDDLQTSKEGLSREITRAYKGQDAAVRELRTRMGACWEGLRESRVELGDVMQVRTQRTARTEHHRPPHTAHNTHSAPPTHLPPPTSSHFPPPPPPPLPPPPLRHGVSADVTPPRRALGDTARRQPDPNSRRLLELYYRRSRRDGERRRRRRLQRAVDRVAACRPRRVVTFQSRDHRAAAPSLPITAPPSKMLKARRVHVRRPPRCDSWSERPAARARSFV